jgi:UMF1 family MFS transporter
VSATTADNRTYRKIISSWRMYDWANSAFATTIMAAMFPPFYRSLATGAGLSEANATAAWAYTSSIALFIIAILAPVLVGHLSQISPLFTPVEWPSVCQVTH